MRRATCNVYPFPQADDEGDDAAVWLSQYLGTSVRLVRFGEAALRETSARARSLNGWVRPGRCLEPAPNIR